MTNVDSEGKTGLQLDKDALAKMLNVKTVNKPIEQRLLSTFSSTFGKSGAKSKNKSTSSTFKKSGAKNRKTRSKSTSSTFKKSGAKTRVKRIPFEQMIIHL